MRRRPWWRVAVPLVAAATLLAGCADGDDAGDEGKGDEPSQEVARSGRTRFEVDTRGCPDASETPAGVTEETIRVGTSVPRSGPLASYGLVSRAIAAHFAYVNEEKGGVRGRRLQLLVKDDAYDAAKTVANVESLLRSGVFALLNIVGTPPNLAVRDILNQACVPQVFSATGFPGLAGPRHPWTLAFDPSYAGEARVYARDMRNRFPGGARVAIVYVDNEFGATYRDVLRSELEGSNVQVVLDVPLDPTAVTVTSEVATLMAARPDVVFSGVTGAFCPEVLAALARSAPRPRSVYQSATCSAIDTFLAPAGPGADGVLTAAYLKDPADPRWAEDGAMRLYREKIARYAPGLDPSNALLAYGWTVAELFVAGLGQAADLDRASLLEAVRNLDGVELGLALPGVDVRLSAEDGHVVDTLQLVRYDAARRSFGAEGALVDLDPPPGS